VPVAVVHEVRADEGADGPQLLHAPHELAAGQVNVVHGQHRHELQAVGTVAAELVDPVVVRLAEGQRELRVEIVAGDEGQPRRRVEHGNVDPFHRHAHHLGLGVIVALDGEVEPARVEDPRARQELRALRLAPTHALAVLLEVHVGGG
jgi:hypothetical protein